MPPSHRAARALLAAAVVAVFAGAVVLAVAGGWDSLILRLVRP